MLLYHLGCGGTRLEGFINVDIQASDATDIVADLNTLDDLPAEPADGFFSHAFFEHLYRDSRTPHLQAVRARLKADGFVCYLGLPDFRRIAELYLAQGPGVEGPTFDLHNVYRLTHGDPEMVGAGGDWLAQLHKSLFDVPTLDRLLRDAGYPAYVIFRYVFGEDSPEIDLSLGCYATAARTPREQLEVQARSFLQSFDRTANLHTLHFEHAAARPEAVAHMMSAGPTRALRHLAHRAACRLAQYS